MDSVLKLEVKHIRCKNLGMPCVALIFLSAESAVLITCWEPKRKLELECVFSLEQSQSTIPLLYLQHPICLAKEILLLMLISPSSLSEVRSFLASWATTDSKYYGNNNKFVIFLSLKNSDMGTPEEKFWTSDCSRYAGPWFQ